MKAPLPLATGFALLLGLSPHGLAGLTIQELYIGSAVTLGSIGDSVFVEDTNLVEIGGSLVPDAPSALPGFSSASGELGPNRGSGFQGKNGYFRNYAQSVGGNSAFTLGESARSSTVYYLRVGTDTPDTRVVLDFHFFGSNARATAYYSVGQVFVETSQRIHGSFFPAGTHHWDTPFAGVGNEVWGFKDEVSLEQVPGNPMGLWSDAALDVVDTFGIGLPDRTAAAINPQMEMSFASGQGVEREAFAGAIDFGILQPGQEFVLLYRAEASLRVLGTYPGADAYAIAEIADPFSLGGTPAPQLSLRALTLPSAPTGLPTLILTAVDPLPAPLLHFRLTGLPGVSHSIESSESLAHESWMMDIPAFPMPASGQFEFTAPWVPGQSRFFRGRATP